MIVQRLCSSSMFRASLCVLCSNFLLFDFMCMRLPFMPWSIAGVPSSQTLPGSPYYCASICARSCCTWRASSVDSKPKKNHDRRISKTLGPQYPRNLNIT